MSLSPRRLQPVEEHPMLPGNFLVVIIVFVLLQPFQGSCGWVGTATEDLHGANWFLNVCTEMWPCQFSS